MTSFWEPCWACRLASGEPCGSIVLETADVIVAINPHASAPGHALVMPRRHVENIFDLPDDLAAPILSTAAAVAHAARAAFSADGITLRQNNGAASDQHLFHFHLHVIPRFAGDVEPFAKPAPLLADHEQQQMARALASALR